MSSKEQRPVGTWIAVALIVLPPVAIFAPALFQDRSLAFRDTAVFYHPLFQWIEQQWQDGELPLWNPHLNYGTPVVGEGSTCVFYPGKAIFLLPGDFAWKFKLFVIGHVFLAAAGAFYAARVFGASREAAILAAVSYACGGAVLFQYCNLVYLIGAAWLPWAFAAMEITLTQSSFHAAIGLAVVMAMMVLGGDPQMAYHVGLASAAYAAGLWWTSRSPTEAIDGRINRWSRAGTSVASLATAALGAFTLSAIQLLPAAEASALSERASYHAPRNIYEAATTMASESDGMSRTSQGLFRDADSDTHAASIYQFSFAPWHLPEYIWPNCSGRYFPEYRRWMMAWQSEPRMWNQSVYLGLLPILLAFGSLRLRRGTTRQQWLSWCAVLAVLGSFGAFGVGWAIRHPLYMAGYPQLAARMPGDHVGGLYWFFVTFLPSYANFRFPAKLLTFAACPLCLLAAQGMDELVRSPRPWLSRVLIAIALISGVASVVMSGQTAWFHWLTQRIAPDTAYGPFDKSGAYLDLLGAMWHTLITSSLILLLIQLRPSLPQQRIALSLVAITAAEIVIANAPLIGTAPSDFWRERPLLAETIEQDQRQRGGEVVRPTIRYPVEHDTIDPGGWHASSSPDRLDELAEADRHLGRTNHALAGPVDPVECLTSQPQADYVYFYKRYRLNDESLWGNYWIMPRNLESIGAPDDDNPWESIESPAFAEATKCKVFRHHQPCSRAWIVHDVQVLPPLKSRDPYALSLRGGEVAEKHGERRDLRREAVVESDDESVAVTSDSQSDRGDSCSVVSATPNRIVIDVQTDRPGLCVLGDTHFPGWMARSEKSGQILPILRTDRIFRGVRLQAGSDRITFEYRPESLYLGATLSGAGWLALLLLAGISSRRTNPAAS
jgi:hypothetical protein